MILQSHPTVNAFNRALAEALERAGRLAEFHTTVAFGRRAVAVPPARLRLHPWRELARLVAQRLGWQDHGGPVGIDAVYRAFDAAVARNLGPARVVYCYEDGALATFRAAYERGLRRVYELPIAYWETTRRLLLEEAERLPPWASTLQAPDDPPEKLARKTEELRLANLVVCPSRFVQSSLPDGTRSIVAEFGSPASPQTIAERRPDGPLRLLFVGTMTQRKGLADLFAAMRLLDRRDIELSVLGTPLAPLSFYRDGWPHFRYESPRPQVEVLGLMDTCDVLVLPSIVEGRALVQQEALSRGLPLLVTPNAGGEDLVLAGETGWLVPIRNPAALADRIAWFADHRRELPGMREAARRMAAARSWDDYTRRIIGAIDSLCPPAHE
ncbi:glycosyl transferase group 1 [Chthoniobacter flavus Ellin428]|uniref:Glycosyl transferase group 1 n=1 Tax=Chthoniobacter flavus Ellin428 TaxID=497964 RepID=B4D1K4_9BACT|nr:glycosyltransferase family 4 protein [Chthoniobacter flavus]EDY19616.1 glycosyl transferase group 1 [Chthoniobacter flavus Ellin428]TCO92854.1 glycosyl transferase family 1 [Chthoniobacter flavus]